MNDEVTITILIAYAFAALGYICGQARGRMQTWDRAYQDYENLGRQYGKLVVDAERKGAARAVAAMKKVVKDVSDERLRELLEKNLFNEEDDGMKKESLH